MEALGGALSKRGEHLERAPPDDGHRAKGEERGDEARHLTIVWIVIRVDEAKRIVIEARAEIALPDEPLEERPEPIVSLRFQRRSQLSSRSMAQVLIKGARRDSYS